MPQPNFNNPSFDDLIRKYTDKYKELKFWAIRAQIAKESNFDPMAMSNKSAKGLMQITPDNFDYLRDKMRRVEGFELLDIFDPEQNIHAGCFCMADLIERVRRNLNPPEHQVYALALAAYNAGSGNVFHVFKGIPPFHETQEYVRIILAQNPGNGPEKGMVA